MKCPTHDAELVPTLTRFGVRRTCPHSDCTVVCWDGSTSTPADAETRALRHKCHLAFDPLWKERTRFKSRTAAYAWLRAATGLSEADAHIGAFTAEQCRKLLVLLGEPV